MMTEYWTPEQQGKIAEAAAYVRQKGTISSTFVGGIGYVHGDGSVMMPPDMSRTGQLGLHVTFTSEESRDLAPNTGHKERVAADKAAGKSPFVKL